MKGSERGQRDDRDGGGGTKEGGGEGKGCMNGR